MKHEDTDTFEYACPHCGATLEVMYKHRDMMVQCDQCEKYFRAGYEPGVAVGKRKFPIAVIPVFAIVIFVMAPEPWLALLQAFIGSEIFAAGWKGAQSMIGLGIMIGVFYGIPVLLWGKLNKKEPEK